MGKFAQDVVANEIKKSMKVSEEEFERRCTEYGHLVPAIATKIAGRQRTSLIPDLKQVGMIALWLGERTKIENEKSYLAQKIKFSMMNFITNFKFDRYYSWEDFGPELLNEYLQLEQI